MEAKGEGGNGCAIGFCLKIKINEIKIHSHFTLKLTSFFSFSGDIFCRNPSRCFPTLSYELFNVLRYKL